MTGEQEARRPSATPRLPADYFRLFWAHGISNLGDGIGYVAWPWLASATTRSGFLVALVVVVQRLPWLVLTLPAGVITDRVDRRKIMITANCFRAVIGALVTLAVVIWGSDLPSPDEVELISTDGTRWGLYSVLLVSTLLLGSAQVLHDNAAQTLMPSVVEPELLEKANGRLWSAEQVADTLLGPIVGALLLTVAFALPFGFDAATFALSAILVASMSVKSDPRTNREPQAWQTELREGFSWLWNHDFLRRLAIILGLINMFGVMTTSTLVLFAQEVLDTSPTEFALLNTGGAAGGVLAGWFAPKVSERIGTGPSLWLTIVGGGATMILTGLASNWLIVWVLFAMFMFTAVLWNVITVSLRQTIIPDELLGRVNSVYRFFAWGSMPIGSLLGGIAIAITESLGDRELALRMPWLIGGTLHIGLILYAGPRLTTARIEAARSSASD